MNWTNEFGFALLLGAVRAARRRGKVGLPWPAASFAACFKATWRSCFALLVLGIAASAYAAPTSLVSERAIASGFALVASGKAVPIQSDPADAAVVAHAANDLANDIAAVSGVRPARLLSSGLPTAKRIVLIGTLGHNAAIDALAARRILDVQRLRGAWESFLIAVVRNPWPGIDSAVVIVGSDRRGTAYGAYELSEAIGVSPWEWWADVPPRRHSSLWLAPGVRRFGPPSVKYRGIFINDEDWGLHPWAARTFEPEAGGIGPRTYQHVFELLLRLKANTLWPAMHKVSKPFNANPDNARLADRYAIVMGSSHAEPMLRDNVGEWKDAPEKFNYAINSGGVRAYWEERVTSNARYDNLWTLGMRGIHDSGVMGATTIPGKVALLSRVIADQRQMLREHVNSDVTQVPQVFMPYKEVLDIYRGGLQVPDDVTIIWPDDNFGYIRQFPNAAERTRAGGSGIYYHLSYLGAPLSYLWLSTTPPALVMEEMTRAWGSGARTVWIVNVGDIKPAETDISLFMEMAWDITRWRGKGQVEFLEDWSHRTFGANLGSPIGQILNGYYSLNFERRPEHLQWWLPGEKPRYSALTDNQIAERMAHFDQLRTEVEKARQDVAPEQTDAFFELVEYPVLASADANLRFFAAERYAKLVDDDPIEARAAATVAAEADDRIKAMTRRFNEKIARGKWRYIMAEEPADNQWRQFRISPALIPGPGLRAAQGDFDLAAKTGSCMGKWTTVPSAASGWSVHLGLGRSEKAVVANEPGATLSVGINVPSGCGASLVLLPTFPSTGINGFLLKLAVDGADPLEFQLPREAETGGWTQAVLDNRIVVPFPRTSPGNHRFTVVTDQAGLVVDGIMLQETSSPTGEIVARRLR